jgi:hypothetical protein
MLLAGLSAVLVGVVGWGWINSSRTKSLYLLALVPICAILAPAFNLRTGHPNLTTTGPIDERIAVINNPWGLQSAAPAILPPNTGTVSGIHELGGYDSLLNRETVALVKEAMGKNAEGSAIDPFPEANGNMLFIKPSADPQKLAEAGVTEVWSRRALEGYSEPISSTDGIFKYRLNGPGRVSSPQGAGKIVEETPNGLKVSATGPGRLIVRERSMPGWRAELETGRGVQLEGSTWLEVDLPEGQHTIEFTYQPPGLLPGLAIGIPAWIIIAALVALKQKRLEDPAEPQLG